MKGPLSALVTFRYQMFLIFFMMLRNLNLSSIRCVFAFFRCGDRIGLCLQEKKTVYLKLYIAALDHYFVFLVFVEVLFKMYYKIVSLFNPCAFSFSAPG